MKALSFARSITHRILPTRSVARKLHWGLAKGAIAKIDFRYDAAFYFGRHEPDLHRHYRKLLKPGMRCFDIGMYRGWDALNLAYMTGGEVVSFDLNPVCIEMAEKFLEPSGLNIKLAHSYVSDGIEGELTIDRAADQYFEPDFIKIDVEGHEAAVLRGATRTLSAGRAALIIETHGESVEADCLSFLTAHGYTPIVVDRSKGIFSEARGTGHNRWLVCSTPE